MPSSKKLLNVYGVCSLAEKYHSNREINTNLITFIVRTTHFEGIVDTSSDNVNFSQCVHRKY